MDVSPFDGREAGVASKLSTWDFLSSKSVDFDVLEDMVFAISFPPALECLLYSQRQLERLSAHTSYAAWPAYIIQPIQVGARTLGQMRQPMKRQLETLHSEGLARRGGGAEDRKTVTVSIVKKGGEVKGVSCKKQRLRAG